MRLFYLLLSTFFYSCLGLATSEKTLCFGILDFSEMERSDKKGQFLNFGQFAFNAAPELQSVFVYLRKKYKINTIIETGTFCGDTSLFFGQLFDAVHTIEINKQYYQDAKTKFEKHPNIHVHLGSSDQVLEQLLPSLRDQMLLFYLDAHWNAYWPLLGELESISKTHANRCIVVIDDFQVPGRKDIPYDYYDGNDCSFSYIEDKLEKIYPQGYQLYYVIPKNKESRAKCLVLPE